MIREKKKNKIKSSKERGITLIALVITIVILIILATVSINVVLGEGGLIQRAQEGKDLTEQARIDEEEELTGAEEYINSVINERKDDNEEETPVQEGIQVDEVTENSISITVNVPKEVAKYCYYINGELKKTSTVTIIVDEEGNEISNALKDSYKFDSLKEETKYYINVEVFDNTGEKAYTYSTEVTTKKAGEI